MKIDVNKLPYEHSQFVLDFNNYVLQMTAHRLTINTPAPFPISELHRVMWEALERGEKIELFDDTLPEEIEPAPAPTKEDIAAATAKRSLWTRILDVFTGG